MNGAVTSAMIGTIKSTKITSAKTKTFMRFELFYRLLFSRSNRLSFFPFIIVLLFLLFPTVSNSEEFATLDEFKALGERFDHLTTGYALTGGHGLLDCGECHIGGVFETLPRECEACHDNVIATGMPSMHVETTAPCDTCHTTSGFLSTAVMDHTTVTNACASCHDGISATGKPANHVLTTDVCEGCHSTNVWSPTRDFDHTHSLGPCFSCHNNIAVAGKPADHMPTTNVCDACHTPYRQPPWLSEGDQVNHSQVQARCSYCHDNEIAIGKESDPDHPVTNEECNACHTAGGSFAGAQP